MDIRILKNQWPRVSYRDLENVMRPRILLDGVIKSEPVDFFNLELIEIGNLYKADKRTIKLRHESSLVIAKCEGDIKESLAFKAEFENQPFFECGINYMGRIRVVRPDSPPIPIKLFGEGSYDPASMEPYLSKHDYGVISGFVVAALYSSKRTGTESFVDRVLNVALKNPSCRRHVKMVEFLFYQIKMACFRMQEPTDYNGFLRDFIENPTEEVLKKNNEDLLNYLYLSEIFDRLEILPCKRYVEILEREREAKHDILAFAKANPEIYIKTDIKFVGKMFRRSLVDMRMLEDRANTIEKDYSQKIVKALEARGEEAENADMNRLSRPYHSCLIF